jgi:hypothetical protein
MDSPICRYPLERRADELRSVPPSYIAEQRLQAAGLPQSESSSIDAAVRRLGALDGLPSSQIEQGVASTVLDSGREAPAPKDPVPPPDADTLSTIISAVVNLRPDQ